MSDVVQRADWREMIATAGVAAIPLLVPLYDGRISIGPLVLDAVVLSIVVALVASAPFIVHRGVTALPGMGIAPYVCVFLTVAAVGIVVIGSPDLLMTWLRYASYFALIPVVGAVAASSARRRFLMWSVLAGGVFALGYATYQFANPGTTRGYGLAGLPAEATVRVFSTFENPNFFAEYLVLLFAVAGALMLTERGLLKGLALGMAGWTGVILLLTYTRGSWIALAIGILVAAAIINWKLIGAVALAGAIAIVAIPGGLARLVSIFEAEGTAGFRMRLWQVAGEVISNHPLLGVGIGDFYHGFQEVVTVEPRLNVGFAFYGAHNSYFQLAAETGVVGGAAFALAIFMVCRSAFAYALARYEGLHARLLASCLLAGVVAFAFNALTSNAFQHPRPAVFFFLVAGIVAGIGHRALEGARPFEVRPERGLVASSVMARFAFAVARSVATSATWRFLVALPSTNTLFSRSVIGARLASWGSTVGRTAA